MSFGKVLLLAIMQTALLDACKHVYTLASCAFCFEYPAIVFVLV